MRFLQQLGPITPKGLAQALKRVLAVLTIVVAILQFLDRLASIGDE